MCPTAFLSSIVFSVAAIPLLQWNTPWVAIETLPAGFTLVSNIGPLTLAGEGGALWVWSPMPITHSYRGGMNKNQKYNVAQPHVLGSGHDFSKSSRPDLSPHSETGPLLQCDVWYLYSETCRLMPSPCYKFKLKPEM